LLLNFPTDLPPDHLELRNKAFVTFLKSACITAQAQSQGKEDPLKPLFAQFIKEADTKGFFNEMDETGMEDVYSIIAWFEDHPKLLSFSPLFKLKISINQTGLNNHEKVKTIIHSFYPHLKKRLLESFDFTISDDLMFFLKGFPPPYKDDGEELILDWMQLLTEECENFPDDNRLIEYLLKIHEKM
jgi:hypothetical protein